MDAAEYDRRRAFVEIMKGMSKPEFVEIARILKKHGVSVSENRSGMYFDMTLLTQEAFDELLLFHQFVMQNNRELEKRDASMQTARALRGSVQHV
jgi:hypothetical protein